MTDRDSPEPPVAYHVTAAGDIECIGVGCPHCPSPEHVRGYAMVLERLRQAIKNSGQTQAEVAAAVGMDPTALSKALGNTRRLSTLELGLICNHLHVGTDHIVSGDRLLRNVLEAMCRRDNLSLASAVNPGEPARNYELAIRLGIGDVFGLGGTEITDEQAICVVLRTMVHPDWEWDAYLTSIVPQAWARVGHLAREALAGPEQAVAPPTPTPEGHGTPDTPRGVSRETLRERLTGYFDGAAREGVFTSRLPWDEVAEDVCEFVASWLREEAAQYSNPHSERRYILEAMATRAEWGEA